MMTREQIKEIMDHSQVRGITIKRRLAELGIPASNYYYAKRTYVREDKDAGGAGRFVQLSSGSPVLAAFPDPAVRKSGSVPAESELTVEVLIGEEAAMRLRGALTPEHLQAITHGLSGRV